MGCVVRTQGMCGYGSGHGQQFSKAAVVITPKQEDNKKKEKKINNK